MRLFALSIVGRALFVEVKHLQYSAKYSVGNIPDVFFCVQIFTLIHCCLVHCLFFVYFVKITSFCSKIIRKKSLQNICLYGIIYKV